MKQETTNFFNQGLLMDVNPITTPNNVLTNCLNGTYVTFNGNDVILQNDMGNGKVERAKLPAGYIPLGIKEYGGIIYVVSYNPFTKHGQVGSFPSPEIDFYGTELNGGEVTITDEDFFYDEQLITTSVKKYLNNEIIKVGDLYNVCVIDENTDVENVLKIINDIKEFHSETIKNGRKILNLKLAVIDSNNNITYLDLEYEDQYESTNTVFGKYFIPIKKEIVDLDKYKVYTYSNNANLMIIAELESLDSMTLDIETISPPEEDYTYKFNVKISPYYFWRWLEIKFKISENNNEEILERYIIKNLYKDDFNNGILIENESLSGVTESLYPIKNINILPSISSSDCINANENSVISWTLNASEKNTIIDYEIIPHMIYGPVNLLKKTGRLNVNRYSDTYVNLVKWNYKRIDNNLTINWGIDYNSRTDQKLYRIDFKFSELLNPNVSQAYTYTTYAGSFNSNGNEIYSHFLSSDYNTLIELGINTLQKNKLYLCDIIYYTIDPNNIDISTLVNSDSRWNLWQTDTRFVYTNDLMDQYYGTIADFHTISPTVQINLEPYSKISRNSNLLYTEDYTESSFLSYSSGRSFQTSVTKTTNFSIDVNAKSSISHIFDYNLTYSVNPSIIINTGIPSETNNRIPVYTPTLINKVTESNGSLINTRPTVDFRGANNDQSLIWNANNYNFVDNNFLNNNIFSINEINCNVSIDENSILQNSRRFQCSSINKSSYTCGRKEETIGVDVNAWVLKKYYSPEYYKDIFGYDLNDGLELSNVNNYPKPTKLYTWCQVHLIDRRNATYPFERRQAKTYIKFSQNSPQSTLLENWQTWNDVTSNLNYSHLPPISVYGSRTKVRIEDNSSTVKYSSDYLRHHVDDSSETSVNWCFPLIKDINGNYALIFIPKTLQNGIYPATTKPITWQKQVVNPTTYVDKLPEVLHNMFDNKYLFQKTNLNSRDRILYVPDPTSYSYNKYDLQHKLFAKVIGNPSSTEIKINNLILNENEVINSCNTHGYVNNIDNFSNVTLSVVYNTPIVEIPILIHSSDFSQIINYTNNNWVDTLNDRLFSIEGNNINDITNSTDINGEVYNKNNYYIYENNNFRTGHGLWSVNEVITGGFRELRLNTSTLLRGAEYLKLGKIVNNYDGSDWTLTWEDKTKSKYGLYTVLESGWVTEPTIRQLYSKLNESPYNFNIFAEPINWD